MSASLNHSYADSMFRLHSDLTCAVDVPGVSGQSCPTKGLPCRIIHSPVAI